MQVSPLRPGLLVAVRTSIKGNCRYNVTEIEADHLTEEGARRARWETEREITDPAEHERATKARSKARSVLASVCAHSDFGLLCPLDKKGAFERAEQDALAIVADFNATAQVSRLVFNVLTGEVMQDDARAIRAINSEMRDLMESMENGLRNLDVEAVREAANKARSVSQMLEPGTQERVEKAIAVARSAARQIVKAAEEGAAEIDRAAIARIAEARTSFLDLDDNGQAIGEVAAPGRAVDFEPVPEIKAAAPVQPRMFDL
jgi:hypothetical protein